MVINNSTNNYTLSSYNMQQKVDVIHSIRIITSCVKLHRDESKGNCYEDK
jgi:hypothetical protein